MELEELVERIQRWKRRQAGEMPDDEVEAEQASPVDNEEDANAATEEAEGEWSEDEVSDDDYSQNDIEEDVGEEEIEEDSEQDPDYSDEDATEIPAADPSDENAEEFDVEIEEH